MVDLPKTSKVVSPDIHSPLIKAASGLSSDLSFSSIIVFLETSQLPLTISVQLLLSYPVIGHPPAIKFFYRAGNLANYVLRYWGKDLVIQR